MSKLKKQLQKIQKLITTTKVVSIKDKILENQAWQKVQYALDKELDPLAN